jgi:nucleotide-binding universal stress UspA family protein
MIFSFPPHKAIVPVDAGGASLKALEWARLLKEKYGTATVVMHAQDFELPPYFGSGQLELLKRELKDSARAAARYFSKQAADALGFEPEVIIVEGPAAEAILDTAAHFHADLVVMGTHGRTGAERVWLGSVAERVLRGSPMPVLAVREPARTAVLSRILCPVTAGDVSRRALEYGVSIAAAAHAHLRVIHVVEKVAGPPPCSFVDDELKTKCETEEVQLQGNAAATILADVHEHRPDLIVMGAERRSSTLGGLFSNTTETVMQRAEAPLLVVPTA